MLRETFVIGNNGHSSQNKTFYFNPAGKFVMGFFLCEKLHKILIWYTMHGSPFSFGTNIKTVTK